MHRNRSFVWGYGHMIIFASIVATGAGLHVAAYYIEHKAHIGPVAALMTVAVPVLIYLGAIYALYAYLVREGDRFHILLIGGTLVVMAASVAAAAAGLNLTYALIILMFAPIVTVIGYETLGHRHQAEALRRDHERSGTVH
jgi:low temperature requirement protein LtrA